MGERALPRMRGRVLHGKHVDRPNAQLAHVFGALESAGAPHGLKLFGSRAVESMRLEKGFLHWKSDILTEFDPYETRLERFVRPAKGDFIGREALAARQANGPTRLRALYEVDERAAELVQLRFFGGLTGDQAAEVLEISPRAADLLWSYARAWLFERHQRGNTNTQN